MKLRIVPVRQMKKGRTKVWVDCEAAQAQAYELRDAKGKRLRRESSLKEATRIVTLFTKKAGPPKDRRTLVGKRWSDVKDKL